MSHKQLGLGWICQRLAHFWAVQGSFSQIWNQPAFHLKSLANYFLQNSQNQWMVKCFLFSKENKVLLLTQANIKEIMKIWFGIINNTNLHWQLHKISIYSRIANRNMCCNSWNYLKGVSQNKFSKIVCF